MGLEAILQSFIYGLQIGAVYVLVALGLTVIFSMMNVMNFAHGEFYMFGAFSIFYITSLLNINYFAALIITMIIMGILLRHSSISKHYLAVFYIAMGVSLIIGSMSFYNKYLQPTQKKKRK